jgi:hypothetical protein
MPAAAGSGARPSPGLGGGVRTDTIHIENAEPRTIGSTSHHGLLSKTGAMLGELAAANPRRFGGSRRG